MKLNKEKFINFILGKNISIDFIARDNESIVANYNFEVAEVEFVNEYTQRLKINNKLTIYYDSFSLNRDVRILNIIKDGYESLNLCLEENSGFNWTEVFNDVDDIEDDDEITNDEKLTLLYLLDKIDCDHCDYDGDTRCENSCVFAEALAALNTDFLKEYGFEDCDGCCKECERVKED